MNKIKVSPVIWQQKKQTLRSVRTQVFIEEQHVPVELEWDDADEDAFHFLGYFNQQPVACARLLPTGQIGRMAVLKPFRDKGIGKALLIGVIHYAEEKNIGPLFLHAQNQAIPFYKKMEFQVHGEEFMDAGIAHHEMLYKPGSGA